MRRGRHFCGPRLAQIADDPEVVGQQLAGAHTRNLSQGLGGESQGCGPRLAQVADDPEVVGQQLERAARSAKARPRRALQAAQRLRARAPGRSRLSPDHTTDSWLPASCFRTMHDMALSGLLPACNMQRPVTHCSEAQSSLQRSLHCLQPATDPRPALAAALSAVPRRGTMPRASAVPQGSGRAAGRPPAAAQARRPRRPTPRAPSPPRSVPVRRARAARPCPAAPRAPAHSAPARGHRRQSRLRARRARRWALLWQQPSGVPRP